METVTAVTTAPTTPGTARTTPALTRAQHRPSKPAFLTQNKAPAQVGAGDCVWWWCGRAQPGTPAPNAAHPPNVPLPWWESSSRPGSGIGPGWVVMVALGSVPRGGSGAPGPGKNQAGGVGNRSRPQRLFTVIKKPRHRAGPDAGNGGFAQKMGQLVV